MSRQRPPPAGTGGPPFPPAANGPPLLYSLAPSLYPVWPAVYTMAQLQAMGWTQVMPGRMIPGPHQQLIQIPISGPRHQLIHIPIPGPQRHLIQLPIAGTQQQFIQLPMTGTQQQLITLPMIAPQQRLIQLPTTGPQQQLIQLPTTGPQQQVIQLPMSTPQHQVIQTPIPAPSRTIPIMPATPKQPRDPFYLPGDFDSDDSAPYRQKYAYPSRFLDFPACEPVSTQDTGPTPTQLFFQSLPRAVPAPPAPAIDTTSYLQPQRGMIRPAIPIAYLTQRAADRQAARPETGLLPEPAPNNGGGGGEETPTASTAHTAEDQGSTAAFPGSEPASPRSAMSETSEAMSEETARPASASDFAPLPPGAALYDGNYHDGPTEWAYSYEVTNRQYPRSFKPTNYKCEDSHPRKDF